jgi:hypothetical protein
VRAALTIADDRAAAVDGAALAALVAAILAGAAHPWLMLAAVSALVVLRTVAWLRLVAGARADLAAELALLAAATALAALNDWNTVVVHEVYEYTVPHGLPLARAVPPWMLLAWGLILRALLTLGRWHRLRPPPAPSADRAWLRVAFLLALVALTRLSVYRWSEQPLLSWLPMAVALLAYVALLGPRTYASRLALIVAAGGTAIEALLIQGAGLHHYALGWLGGVPLWITLWWPLGTLVWCELATRASALTATSAPASEPVTR